MRYNCLIFRRDVIVWPRPKQMVSEPFYTEGLGLSGSRENYKLIYEIFVVFFIGFLD